MPHRVFRHTTRLNEVQKILCTPRFSACSREAKPSKRLPPNQRASDPTINIQIPHAKSLPGGLQVRRLAAENPPGQFVNGSIGHIEGLLEVGRAKDRQHGAENLFAGQAMPRLDAREDVRANHRLADPLRQPAGTSQASSRRPSLRPTSMYCRILAAAASSMTGPTSVPGSAGSPITRARVDSTSR